MRAAWILALAAAGVSAAGAAPAPGLDAARREKIGAAVARFMKDGGAPGVTVAVVENGEFEWAQGYGLADLEQGVPASPATLYRLASVSKALTAVGAMELWERGRLDLDAPVQKYCPSFPKKEYPVTTRELLGHLGGIRHYRSDSPDDPEIGNTRHFAGPIHGGLSFFANDPLIEKPGAKFHYSTQGFTLVGCAIEGASGMTFVDYMREKVFVPAGMTRLRVDDRYAIVPNRTRFYSQDSSGTVVNSEFLDSSYKIPGGGWIATAEDLARFESAMLDDRLVKRSTRDLMWASQKTSAGEETHYGYGWRVDTLAGLPSGGHSGGQAGASTYIRVVPAKRAGVVVLANMDGLDTTALARELMAIVIGAP